MASRTPNVILSASNEFDNLARYVHQVEVSRQQLQQQQPQQLMQLAAGVNDVEEQYSASDEPRKTDDFDNLPQPVHDLL